MTKTPAKQQGFILVAAIWVMAILLMMVAAFALWVESSLGKALEQNQKAQLDRDMTSTHSVLLYLVATQSGTAAGITLPAMANESNRAVDISLDDFFANATIDEMGAKTIKLTGNELKVDGTTYEGVGDSLFTVIDQGGLIPLNSKSVTHTKQLLRFLNVETPLISRLTATSQDFLDKDESVRPNGAEAFEYQQRGMKQPANTELLSRFELRRVLGWDSVENLWSNDALLSAMAANVSSRYNVNAMPPIVAQVVFGLTDAEVEVFLEHRTEKSFTSVRELVDRTGIDFYANFEKIKLTPSRGFRFSFWYPQARLKRELDVHFPSVVSAGDSPWIISRDLVLPITEPNALVEPRKAQTDLFR